jgi:hypothetical protein
VQQYSTEEFKSKMEGTGGQQASGAGGGGGGKNPFDDLRKKMEAAGKTQHGPSSAGGMGPNLEQARKLLYAKNSSEARNVASFMRLTNYAWSGISFALLFAFSMSALYRYFKKPEPQEDKVCPPLPLASPVGTADQGQGLPAPRFD